MTSAQAYRGMFGISNVLFVFQERVVKSLDYSKSANENKN